VHSALFADLPSPDKRGQSTRLEFIAGTDRHRLADGRFGQPKGRSKRS
jgi:hypothetical protein